MEIIMMQKDRSSLSFATRGISFREMALFQLRDTIL